MTSASRWEWLDFDEAESRQVRDFLTQDIEGEGVDPLRIGSAVRDRVAEGLFPGTSTQYTRLRYVLLAPAILGKKGATIGNIAQHQTALNQALGQANPDETGLIGRRTPTRDFVHLYWTAVRTWKLLTPLTSDRDTTVANGLAAFHLPTARDEEGNSLSEHRVTWHPEMVKLAAQFWASSKASGWPSIHCRQAEVDFLLGQWLELPEDSSLAAIASELRRNRPQSGARYPWHMRLPHNGGARARLERAKGVSLICWSAQLAYNLALLEAAGKLEAQGVDTTWKLKRNDLDRMRNRIDKLHEDWKAAFEAEKSMLGPWRDVSCWVDLETSAPREFLASTAGMLIDGKTDLASRDWASWVKQREKVNPAPKLSNTQHLATWSGTPEMAQRWDFRWRACVQRFVKDAENPRG